ncbi:hypothetical protein DPMN_041388 [Dreissena polymorpha]|uniref:Uncharacterized protein n=1 Tax=Dreissena polymorpha TaxID=45954 RepID=A0A9D4D038_DREPO|nr:hypothetical protein DPMN_041388 [Dreissena polymorpha]
MVQGDWNANVGPDGYQDWSGTYKRFGLGEINDRGLRLRPTHPGQHAASTQTVQSRNLACSKRASTKQNRFHTGT